MDDERSESEISENDSDAIVETLHASTEEASAEASNKATSGSSDHGDTASVRRSK